ALERRGGGARLAHGATQRGDTDGEAGGRGGPLVRVELVGAGFLRERHRRDEHQRSGECKNDRQLALQRHPTLLLLEGPALDPLINNSNTMAGGGTCAPP